MPIQEKYTQRLGLANLDVYLDTPDNDNTYFTIGNLPETMGYGKHGFTIIYNDPINDDLLLKNNTGILFEFVDANGETVFSELSDIPDISGAATGYVWIKKDPLWIAQEITDGPLTLYVVGELEGVPEEFEGTYNVRSTFTYNVRKSFPNTSKIIFYDIPALEESASFTETQEEDRKPGYTRGYINVSSSFMQTHGGKVSFIELSYRETGSQANNFTVMTEYPVEGPTSRFEVVSSSADGLNPLSHIFKAPIPRSIRRDTPVIFKLRFLDAEKTPAKYYDENRQNQNIEITSSAITINGTPMVIEREDNLLKGSMFTGEAVGKGFETSGKSSAFMKTVDYTGFISASTHIGKSGIMFFSGSVLSGSGDDYRGVGLELVGDSESLFRFRSSPSVLDIKTREFFVGSSQQFISASKGRIEISSSHFHLDPSGDVSFSGSIDASSGRIGGFVISSSEIHSDVDGRRDLRLKANGQISASSILLASSSFVIDPNNLQRYGQDGFGSFVMANSTGVSIQTTDFNLNTARFVISSSDVGVIAMGSNPPVNFDNGKGVYMSGDGNFLAGDSHGERMQFNGFNLVLSSSAFFLGNERSFMSGSQGKILVSGSDISLMTEKFFFGTATHFISGSLGNMEISSSNFAMSREGDVTLAGEIRARTGEIGGFNIGRGALSSDNFFISGAASGTELFISSSGFSVDARGVVSASDLSLQGGDVGGLNVAEGTVSVGEILKLKDSGQITGSQVLFTGGKIGGFNIDAGSIRSSNGNDINLDATNKRFSINTPTFGATGIQLQFNGGTPRAHIGVTNQQGITFDGTNLLLNSQAFFLGNNDNFVSGSNGNIKISGSNVSVETPSFFLGNSAQFVSGSNGNIEITSSNFHLDSDGTLKTRGEIRATSGTIGGFTIGDDLDSTSGTLKLKGASGQITASDAQISGKITAETGTIGGFNIGDDLDSTAGTLKLKGATGQITASDAQITGKITAQTGTIGGFNIGTNLESTVGTLNLKGGSGQITGSRVLLDGGVIGGFELGANIISSSNGNLILKSSGQITASDAQLVGKVTATSGQIAGWTIVGDTLVGNNATLDGAGAALFKSDQGPGTDSSATFDQARDEYYIDFTPTQGPTNSAGQFYVKFGPNFSINNAGVLFASGAQFEGTVSASKGIIGGFTTDASSFSSVNLFISGSPGIGGIHHPKYMFISSSNFNVKQNGDVTGSQVLFTGGKVGGWTMTDSTLTGGVVTLNSAGSIEVGGLTDATTTATTNSGFFADSSGNVLIKGNVSDNDYLKISAGGGIDIRSQVFDLDAGTLVIDSATRNGTIALGATPNVNIDGTNAGVYMNGLGDFLVRVDANNFIKVDQDASTKLDMKAQTFFLGASDQFISGSGGTIAITSSNFHLDTAGNVNMAGTITATAGKIAGFTISGDSLTATNFEIDASGKRITLGDPSSTDLFVADADEGIQLGNNTFGLAPFSVTKGGVLKAVAGTVGGYGISATAISSSNNNLILKNSGQITGSTVLFTGGKIGGFTIDADEIKSENLLLDSSNEKITVGSANAITIQGGGTDNFIVMGSKSAFAQTSTAGVILGMDNNVPSFDMTRNATNYMRFDTSTGVDIKTDTFKLDTATLDIDSSTSRIQVVNGSSNEVVRLGEISDSASDLYGLKVYDGSGTADSNILVKLGGEGNTIGGWTITNDQIQSQNLVIHSSGRLETADFASGVKGWRIDSEGNGTAEFENATIRGTLSTAVFEKETVNAVGGQLYVANSTVLSGSGITSASFTTMSVENVSGFVQGEIASLKKVSETGFSTEYIFINSASRNDRSSDTDFSGNLFVIRGYSGSLGGQTGSLGGSPNAAQDYNPGQVLVSTGRVGTGYIRLNANPNDSATPYMDIVERTGSAIYDIELKTRVGDLSGLSSATLFGNSNPGFGIFTENGFFKGGINATTGSFTGAVHINTSANELMKLGTNIAGTNDGLHINNNNFWYTTGQFKTGNANNFISHDGNGNVKIISENFTLKGGTKLLMTSESLAFDTSNATTATRTAGTGVFMDKDGNFRVGNASGNRLTFTGTSLELVTDDLNIDTSTFDLSTDGTGKIALGATPPTSISSGTGVFMDGAGNFLAGNTGGNFIRFNQTSGAVQVAGEINITAGALAGVTPASISGSAQSGLNALEAGVSASIDSATGSLSSSLATAIGDVSSSAGQGISSANSATAAASTAQSAIDTMETQVDLTATGMHLKKSAAQGGTKLVTYGTTTKFFDGVGETEGNMKLRLNTDGVFAFANTTESFARFYNEGVQLVSGSVEFAKFAGTTTIGNTSTEHVKITDSGLELKDGSTTRLSMDSSGMQIGSAENGITLNSNGDATFNGTITVSGPDIAGLTGSLDSAIAGASASAAAGQSGSALLATQVVLDSNGMSLKNAAANKTLASFGTTVVIGENADDKSRMVLDNDSLDLIVDAGGTDTTHASFGATTTIGPTATEHIEITSTSLKLKDGNSGSPITHITINSSGMQIGSVSDGITLDTSGNATFNGTITLPSGTVSGSGQLADAISGSGGADSASLASRQSAYETQVELSSAGMALKNTSGTTLASYGTTTTIGIDGNDQSRIFIDSDSVDLIVDDSGVDTTRASFGATTTVGATTSEHVKISSTGLELKSDNSTTVGKFTAKGATIGNTNGGHISASTLDVHIKKDNDNFSKMDADSFDIVLNGKTSASFGATTTIGSTNAAHTFIDSGSFRLKDGDNVRLQMDAKGIRMGPQFSVDSSGNATFGGSLTITPPPPIGTVSSSAQLADAISGSLGDVSSSLASGLTDASSSAGQGINAANAAQADATAMATQVVLDSNGMSLKNQAADITLANFGTTVTVGRSDALNQNVHIDSDSIDIRRGTQVTASFGATTTIGPVSSAHTFIDSGSLRLKDGNDERLIMDAKGIRMGNDFSVDSSGNASFSGALTIGTALANSISGSVGDVSASLASDVSAASSSAGQGINAANAAQADATAMATQVVLDSDGMALKNQAANVTLAEFGTTVTVGRADALNQNVFIDSDSIDIRRGTQVSASFGATTTIGPTSSAHTFIDSGSLRLKDASSERLIMDAKGIRLGDNFSVDDSGNVTMAGTVTATAGNIGGFDINSVELRKDIFDSAPLGDSDRAMTQSFEVTPKSGSHQSQIIRMLTEQNAGNATLYEVVSTQPGDTGDLISRFGRFTRNYNRPADIEFLHAESKTRDLSLITGSYIEQIASKTTGGTSLSVINNGPDTGTAKPITSKVVMEATDGKSKLFLDGGGEAVNIVSASQQLFTSNFNLVSPNSTSPLTDGTGVVLDLVASTNSAVPGVFIGNQNNYFRFFGRPSADVLQISSSNFILDAGDGITPKLEIKGNITAEGGVIGGFEIEQGNGVNPYDNTSVSNLVARTTTFNTASIVASNSPYFEFQSGVDGTGHTTYSHVANTGKTIQKMIFSPVTPLNQLTTNTGNVRGFFNEAGQNHEFDMAYIKTRATAAVNGILTEYTNNKIGNTSQGQRILLYAASGSSGNSSGLRTNSGGSHTEGAGIIFQYIDNGHYQTSVVLGNIGTDLANGHGDTGTDAIHTTATPETTHGLLLTDNSRLVLTKSSTLFAGNGSSTTPSICFTTTSDGFFHDGNGINLMVNNVHDFLFKNGGEFHADADVIAFSTTISDEKLKNDVKTIDFALDKVKKLRGVEYTWNKGGRKGQKDLGVIAQEVEKVIPEVVRDKEMPLMDDSGETYKTVDYEKLTAVLIEGMKEQQKQINELKEEVKELKNGSAS